MGLKSVRFETDGRVATVTLDRPASGNAVDHVMAAELSEACVRVNESNDIRVVVLTGSGDSFCVGTEYPDLTNENQAPAEAALGSLRAARYIAAIDGPVVAALNGDAIDQGLELALACDLRVASSSARLGLTQVKDGLIPWDGGTQRLPRLIGMGRAMEMVIGSRMVDAAEALQMGLVNHVTAPGAAVQKALEIASTIASMGPVAARYAKEAVQKGLDMTLDQGLRLEGDLNLLLHSTADRAEGIRSFLERRRPEYRGE